jgi:hypothetical protein
MIAGGVLFVVGQMERVGLLAAAPGAPVRQ